MRELKFCTIEFRLSTFGFFFLADFFLLFLHYSYFEVGDFVNKQKKEIEKLKMSIVERWLIMKYALLV